MSGAGGCKDLSGETGVRIMEENETNEADGGLPKPEEDYLILQDSAEDISSPAADGNFDIDELDGQGSEDISRSTSGENSFPDSSETGKTPSENPSSNAKNFEIGNNVTLLHCNSLAATGQCSVYIVGTSHVSQESCKEVRTVIQHVRPQVVFVELCTSRIALLMPQKLQVPTFEEMLEMWRNKSMNTLGIIYSWFLAKIAERLEVLPGSEFCAAYEEAISCGATVSLGDRPVQITLRRTWAMLSLWQKAKLVFGMVFQGLFMPSAAQLSQVIEELKDTDMITVIIQEMSKSFPTLIETLLRERDLYMAASLRNVAQHCSSVVAVVGKGHLSGITRNWEREISIEALMVVPKKKPSRILQPVWWGCVALVVGGLTMAVSILLSQRS